MKTPQSLDEVKTSEANLQELATLADQATDYGHDAKSKATHRAYASDLRDFEAFCKTHGVDVLPATPQTVALYLTDLASTKTVSTITRRMVAIAQAHKNAGLPNPVADPHVRAVIQGIKRNKGTAQYKKTALTREHLKEALATIDTATLKGKRDRAMFLLTWFTACRRSEIAALNVEDLSFKGTGLIVTIRRSKTDQEGKGRPIGVPYIRDEELCAVTAVKVWLEAASIKEGALFRSFDGGSNLTENRIEGQDVARLVKAVVKKAGLDGDFSAHSLRAGFITEAASTKGVSEVDIQSVFGHRSVTILRSYVRKASVLIDCPAAAMFGQRYVLT